MSLVRPEDILAYWIGPADNDAGALEARHKLWFGKSDAADIEIAERFVPTLAALASGLAEDWAENGPHPRLAAIIALDQFSRNIFRGRAAAFENDRLALGLAKDGLMRGEDSGLSEVERAFFYLPVEHSERAADQVLSVQLFERLAEDARPEFRGFAETCLDYARQHKAVIDRFGRYPHRNAALGRQNTPEEEAYLAEPGAGF